MTPVVVRDVHIGEGIPKICVPVVGTTEKNIIEEAMALKNIPVDVVEWRADWFEGVCDYAKVERVLVQLREALGNLPLLFTFRTLREGGERDISVSDYAELNRQAARSGYVDLIDVEAFTGDEVVQGLIADAHACGVKVVASNHDFDKTPEKEEIIRRLCRMLQLGADISKIAVMPRDKKDVLTLLSATEEMVREYADRPVITMSMSGTGMISRVCGEVFGSSITFGAASKASAPGQIDVNELETMLGIIHKSL